MYIIFLSLFFIKFKTGPNLYYSHKFPGAFLLNSSIYMVVGLMLLISEVFRH